MRNRDVVKKFIDKEYASGSNLYSSGSKLFSYNTCIAQWYNNTIIINNTKYSSSTSRHQFYLRSLAVIALHRPDVDEIRSVNNIEINSKKLW